MHKLLKVSANGLTLVLSTPYLKGLGLALGFRSDPRARTLWIWVLIYASPISLKKGWSGQLGPRYNCI
jgi:hypothetical protein